MELQSTEYKKLQKVCIDFYSINLINKDMGDRLLLISLVCYVTSLLQKKDPSKNCFDALLAFKPNVNQYTKDTFYKSLGAICDMMMQGCSDFPTFNIAKKDISSTLDILIGEYCPF